MAVLAQASGASGANVAATLAHSKPGSVKTIKARDGRTVVLVRLGADLLATPAQFARVAGKNATITFWCGDAAGNVVYSWTFNGKDARAACTATSTWGSARRGW